MKHIYALVIVVICSLLFKNNSIAATIACKPKAGYLIPFKFTTSKSSISVEMNGARYFVKKKKNYVSSDGYKVVYLEGEGIFVAMYPDNRMIIGSMETDKVITAGHCK